MKKLILAGVVFFGIAPAFAQSRAFREPDTTDAIVQVQPNTTGNDIDVIISRGATGAGTITTNSAAGGNARLPERAVPNGSAGGGGGSGGQ